MDPVELLNSLIDAEADYEAEQGHPPEKLKLSVRDAYTLAKLPRDRLGDLAGRVMKEGITVFEQEYFLGVPVEIVRTASAVSSFE